MRDDIKVNGNKWHLSLLLRCFTVLFSVFYVGAIPANGFTDISIKQNNCLSDLAPSLPEYTNLPKLDSDETLKWKKSGNESEIVLPKHNLVFVSREDAFRHINITYYFETTLRKGFVAVQSGITDIIDWYGIFYLNDEVFECVSSIVKGKK